MLDNILETFRFLRACVLTILTLLNMLIFGIVIFIFASLARLMPTRKLRHTAMRFALKLPVCWMLVNKYLLKLCTYKKWDIQGTGALNPKGWYVLISNHHSWVDIPVLGSVFSGKAPVIKFFMKKSLLWQLPPVGFNAHLLDYPLMDRHSRSEIKKHPELKDKDIETAKKACRKVREFPTTFMNFIEGTRFSKAKQKRQNAPYKNLLQPKAGGVAIVINEMQDNLEGIINVTIHYDTKNRGLWYFLCGKVDKIHIRYEVLPITENLTGDYYKNPVFRKSFQKWLNQLWHEKDQIIETLKNGK